MKRRRDHAQVRAHLIAHLTILALALCGCSDRGNPTSPTPPHADVDTLLTPMGSRSYTSGRVHSTGGDTANPTSLRIVSFSPRSTEHGGVVEVLGEGFGSRAADVRVSVGNTMVPLRTCAPQRLTFGIHDSLLTGPIVVTIDGVTVRTTDALTIRPTILGFSPTSGMPGGRVTITTANLDAASGDAPAVFFGHGGARIVLRSRSALVVDVPPDAATGPIAVEASAARIVSKEPFTVARSAYRFTGVRVDINDLWGPMRVEAARASVEPYRAWDTTYEIVEHQVYAIWMNMGIGGAWRRDESVGDTIRLRYGVPWDSYGDSLFVNVTAVVQPGADRFNTLNFDFSKRLRTPEVTTMRYRFTLSNQAFRRNGGTLVCRLTPAEFVHASDYFYEHTSEYVNTGGRTYARYTSIGPVESGRTGLVEITFTP